MKYRIIRADEAADGEHPMGTVREYFAAGLPFSIARITMSGDKPHFHKETTEVYCVLDGCGTMRVDGNDERLSPGDVIIIQPETEHSSMADEGKTFDLLVISSPPYRQSDSFPTREDAL